MPSIKFAANIVKQLWLIEDERYTSLLGYIWKPKRGVDIKKKVVDSPNKLRKDRARLLHQFMKKLSFNEELFP